MAKTSKIAKAPKSFKSYALNKCLIGYGVVNGIINAAIFAGINAGAPDAMFGMHDIVHDLAFTGNDRFCGSAGRYRQVRRLGVLRKKRK